MLRKFWTMMGGPAGRLDWLRACVGALCGIVITGAMTRLWLGEAAGLPVLIAPMGASAVLLFAVPASPLARPWSIFGGNVSSALVGIGCAKLVPDPIYASGCAVGLAIGLMRLTRCLHPPGGAAAVTAVIGGPAVIAAGWSFAFMPVAVNSGLLLAVGWLFNNATRHSYPHRPQAVARPATETADPPPQDRVGYTAADIDAVLARYDELLDVSREDLDALFRQVEAQAYRRLHGVLGCDRVMSRDLIAVAPETPVEEARALMLRHHVSALPVVVDGRPVGLVGLAELLGAERSAGEVMETSPCVARVDTPVDELLPVMSGGRYHAALIVDAEGMLVGIITQTDLLAALWRGHIAEQVVASGV